MNQQLRAATTQPATPDTSSYRGWIILAVLFAINFMNFYDRQILPVVQEEIRKDWELSDRELGWLGTAFILLYAVAGLPLGRLADLHRRTWVLSAGVAVWSLMTAASAGAWNFASLFVSRLGVGVGEASCAPASSSILGDAFGPERRSRVLSIFMLGLPLGLGVSSILSGMFARRFGWQAAFLIPAIPGFALAVMVLFVGEVERGQADRVAVKPGKAPSFFQSLGDVLSRPTLCWIILSGAAHNFNTYALGTFLTSVIRRYHRLGSEGAGLASGLVWGIGALGMFLAGWLGDAAFRRRLSGRLEVSCAAILCSIPLLLVGLAVPPGNPWPFAFWLLLTYAMMSAYYGTVYATIQDIIEPSLRVTAMAVYFCAMYVLGAVWGPVATGWVSDRLAVRASERADVAVVMGPTGKWLVADEFRAVGLHQAMYMIPVISVVLVLILFAASRTVSRDRQRMLERQRVVET